MATQEQKDKKVATAQRRVNSLRAKVSKATERKNKAEAALAALSAPLTDAEAWLKFIESMPVNGVVDAAEDDSEPEDGEGTEDGEPSEDAIPAEPEAAWA